MLKNKITYEEAVSKLEKILEDLEGKDLSLDESIKKFKEGLSLHKVCNDMINKAEGEIKILIESDDTVIEKDFGVEE